MKFNKDDTVCVNNYATSYHGRFNGATGTVEVVHATETDGIRYGLRLTGIENEAGRTGLFWFSGFELSYPYTIDEFVKRMYALPAGYYRKTVVDYCGNNVIVRSKVAEKIKNPCLYLPKIKKVIFNPPATIIFWQDDTKTVVKAVNEPYDPEKGLAMAISKKAFGNNQSYYSIFEKNLKKF